MISKSTKTPKWLEWAAHSLLVVAIAFFAVSYFSKENTEQNTASQVADVSSLKDSYDLAVEPQLTAILIVSPTCIFCERSMDYYAKLSRDFINDDHVEIIAFMSESANRQLQVGVFEKHDVQIYSLISIPLEEYDIVSVPDFYLVNRSQEIVYSHLGMLTEIEYSEIEETLISFAREE
ncbi:MAG: hypothetical protein AAF730_06325 [Bacteroidota bacterium]